MSTDSNAWTDPGWIVCRVRPPGRGLTTSTRTGVDADGDGDGAAAPGAVVSVDAEAVRSPSPRFHHHAETPARPSTHASPKTFQAGNPRGRAPGRAAGAG